MNSGEDPMKKLWKNIIRITYWIRWMKKINKTMKIMLIEWKKIKTIEFNKLKLLKMKEIKKEL